MRPIHEQLIASQLQLLMLRLMDARSGERGLNLHRKEVALALALIMACDPLPIAAIETNLTEQDNE